MFRKAVEAARDWRDEAETDYRFWAGDQWDASDKAALNRQRRPTLTINRIRPLCNLLSGYQRLNRYEPDFLPRTPDDLELAKIRKGVTKFVFDDTGFDSVEARCFLDSIISGLIWSEVGWEPDPDDPDGDGHISIQRVSGFDVYPDPVWWRDFDIKKASHVFRTSWLSMDELKQLYWERADDIDTMNVRVDVQEDMREWAADRPLWWDQERKQVRLVTCWERKYGLTPDITVAVFAGDMLLEDHLSPYEHGQFPLVPLLSYAVGEGEIPAGVVRDIRDPQKEINKRRSQWLDYVNRMSSGGWLVSDQSMTHDQEQYLRDNGSAPGIVVKYRGEAPRRLEPPQVPANLVSMEQACAADIQQISGINEAMLGQDMPASASGRAIELRQRQATTQIALLFDNLRAWKKNILTLLWGKGKRRGIIQQFYTAPRMLRVVSSNGETQFVGVNQQVPMVDPMTGQPFVDPFGNLVMRTLNDLSIGQFDIVISDTPATATQRLSHFYALIEAAKVGIQIPPDVLLDASDIPQKEEIKQRMLQAQQQAMMQQQMQAGGGGGAPPGEMGGPMSAQEQIRQQAPVM